MPVGHDPGFLQPGCREAAPSEIIIGNLLVIQGNLFFLFILVKKELTSILIRISLPPTQITPS